MNLLVRFFEIDDKKMQYTAQITFREYWNDPRLSYSEKPYNDFIPLSEPSMIWTPDLFFSNELEGFVHKTLTNNQFIRIKPNGDVLWSSRVTLKLTCMMNFADYPFDMQECIIKLGSFRYTTDNIVLSWSDMANPVQVAFAAQHLPNFHLVNMTSEWCTSKTKTGEYGCLSAHFMFVRQNNQFYAILFLPCCMLVLISYLAFWIKDKTVKYVVAIVALVAASALIWSLYLFKLPNTSYIMAIDYWNMACISFLVATVLLLVIFENLKNDKPEGETGEFLRSPLVARLENYASKSEIINRISYPIAFVLFVVVYFARYLSINHEY